MEILIRAGKNSFREGKSLAIYTLSHSERGGKSLAIYSISHAVRVG